MDATTGWLFDEPGSEENTAPIPAIEPESTRRRRGWPRRVFGWLAGTVASLVVAAILAMAIGLTLVPVIAGGHTLTVLSGSMVPRLPVGSVVVDKPAAPSSLQVGDIVTYHTSSTDPAFPNALVTHRIIAKKRGAHGPVFTTKGDANNTADEEPVQASQIRGKLWYDVPYIGTIRNFLTSKAGLTMIGGAVLLIAAVWFLIRVNRPSGATGKDGES
jgi:signal peptidase